jgi:hypothetical protein
MAQRFLTNIDLVQNQLINGQFEAVAVDPTTGNFEGRLIYNSTEKVIKVYTGTVWRKALHSISSSTTALTSSESNGTVTLSIADVVAAGASGLMVGADKTKLDNATATETPSTLVLRDTNGRFKASNPSTDLDVANKAYVDAARSGLDVKASVRATTTAPIILEDLQTIDDVVLVAGNRVLVRNQADPADNGIYDVVDNGPWVRSADADQNFEVTAGMFTFVEEGTLHADSGWVLTTNDPIVVGTTSLVFAQFSGAGQITAGTGMTKDGNTLNVNGTTNRISVDSTSVDIASTYVGQTSITTLGTITTGTWNGTDVAVADGGTGSSTASGARTNLAGDVTGGTTNTPALARVASQTITGAFTEFDIDHNFNTRDVVVQVFDNASYDTIIVDVIRSTVNRVKVLLSVAPGAAEYRVVVTG